MPRYYKRYYPRYRKQKYSNETYSSNGYWSLSDLNGNGNIRDSFWVEIVKPSANGGVRKCKNFTFTAGVHVVNDGVELHIPYQYLLVYVPEGQDASSYQTGAGSLYEPNQNVIMAGSGTSGSPLKGFTRLARNLNSGDTIQLILLFTVGDLPATTLISAATQLNYNIAY